MVKINLVKSVSQSSINLLKASPGSSALVLDLVKDNFKKAAEFLNLDIVPPLETLVPLGNSPFKSTPDEPADPQDCDAWPNSPFCGGVPLTNTFIGIEPAIVVGNCDVGIQLTPVIGFVTLPPLQLVFHSSAPECNPKKAKVPPPDSPINFCVPYTCSNATNLGTVTIKYQGWAMNRRNIDIWYPHDDFYPEGGPQRPKPYGSGENDLYFDDTNYDPDLFPKGGSYFKFLTVSETFPDYGQDSICFFGEPYTDADGNQNSGWYARSTVARGLLYEEDHPLWRKAYESKTGELPFYWKDFEILSIECDLVKPPPEPIMQCCPPAFDPALLQLILINQNKIMKAIGVDEYPASLPATLISKDEGFLGNLIPNPNVQINNLTQLAGWTIERFDEVMGQWEIPIEIKDSDPTTPGDQPKGFKLSNLAEAQAELMQLAFQSFLNTEVLLSITTRNLLESGQIKQQDFKNFALTQALVDYIGFSYKDVQRNLPLTFTLNKEDFDELLVESEIKVAVAEFDDKVTFRKELLKLLDAAAITKAVNWRKLDTKSGADVKQQFKDVIKNQAAMLKKLSDDEKNADGDDNLDRFIKDAKIAFSNSSGMPPISQPFGRDIDEGPEIERFDE